MCVVNCTPTRTPERSALLNECTGSAFKAKEERKEKKWVKEGVIERERKRFICPHTEPVSRVVKRGYYFNVCHFLLS